MVNPAGNPVAPGLAGAQTWRLIDACVLPAQVIVGVVILGFLPAAEAGVVIGKLLAAKVRKASSARAILYFFGEVFL
jgi:hypothetical protein